MIKKYYITLQDGVIRDYIPEQCNFAIFEVLLNENDLCELERLFREAYVAEFKGDIVGKNTKLRKAVMFIKEKAANKHTVSLCDSYLK